jgi:hypothetical protein
MTLISHQKKNAFPLNLCDKQSLFFQRQSVLNYGTYIISLNNSEYLAQLATQQQVQWHGAVFWLIGLLISCCVRDD